MEQRKLTVQDNIDKQVMTDRYLLGQHFRDIAVKTVSSSLYEKS